MTLSGAVRVVRSEDKMPDAIREALGTADLMRNENRRCSTACSGTRWMENQPTELRKNSSSAPVCTRKRASST